MRSLSHPLLLFGLLLLLTSGLLMLARQDDSRAAWLAFVSEDGQGQRLVERITPDGKTRRMVQASLNPNLVPTTSANSAWLVLQTDDYPHDRRFEIYQLDDARDRLTFVLRGNAPDRIPAWSPDGRRQVFDSGGLQADIYLLAATDEPAYHWLTRTPDYEGTPAWSPDGQWLAFASNRAGNADLYLMRPDGSGIQQLTDDPGRELSPAWSPDGSHIAYMALQDGQQDIFLIKADGSDRRRVTHSPLNEGYPFWSRLLDLPWNGLPLLLGGLACFGMGLLGGVFASRCASA
jgi:WD40 repeat protein